MNEIIKWVSETEKPSKKGLELLVTLKFRRKWRQYQHTCQDEVAKKVRENSSKWRKYFQELKSIDSWVPLQIKRTSISVGSHRKFAFLKASQIFLKHNKVQETWTLRILSPSPPFFGGCGGSILGRMVQISFYSFLISSQQKKKMISQKLILLPKQTVPL